MKQYQLINNKTDWLYSVSLLLMLFLPHVGFLYIINPLLVLILAFRNRVFKFSNIGIIYVLVALIVISFFVNVLEGTEVSAKPFYRAVGLIICFVLFPFSENECILKSVLYFSILFILFSQLCDVLGLRIISSFFSRFYIGEETTEYIERYMRSGGSLSVFRLGGLFNNPNQCARYVTCIFIIFTIDYFNEGLKKHLLISVLCAFSLLLTGSRTGLFVFLIILTFSYVLRNRRNKLSVIMVTLLFSSFFLFAYVFSDLGSSYRAFALDSGVEDSFSGKLGFIAKYLNSDLTVSQWLFGNFFYTQDAVQRYLIDVTTMDSEFGVSIFTYGFAFTIPYIILLLIIYKKLKRQNVLIILIFLWCLSSTIIFSYRASFLVLFLLSKYYSASIKN